MTQPEKRIAWEEYNIDKDSDTNDLDDEEVSEWEENEKDGHPMLIMGGQHNQIPKEFSNPFKYSKWHKCHTNFNVTMNMLLGLEKVIGIEHIIPLTRYSFIIAVAKLFSDSDVKESVKESILHGEIIYDKKTTQ